MFSRVQNIDFLWQSQRIPWFLNSNLQKNWFFLWLSAKTMISRVPKPVFLWPSQGIHWFSIAKAGSDLKKFCFSCDCYQNNDFRFKTIKKAKKEWFLKIHGAGIPRLQISDFGGFPEINFLKFFIFLIFLNRKCWFLVTVTKRTAII